MKANVPERIWIEPTSDLPKLNGHIDKDSVEYTRTDAFIQKACEWLNICFISHDEYGIISNQFNTKEEMIEDFKQFMKGE